MREPKDITILIVDDEETLRRAIVFDFKRKGFQTLEASNGRDAFDIVTKQKVDIIISDVRMPGGDGLELLNNVKARDPVLPVVMFITGFADMSLEEAYEKGADAVLSKPFDRKALFAAVTKATVEKEDRWVLRGTDREAVSFEITLKFPELAEAVKGRVLNIGRGGIFVALDAPFPQIGSLTSLRIEFADGQPKVIEGEGRVRWVRTHAEENKPSGSGIEFETLSDSSGSAIRELIDKLKTKAFIPQA
jgi:CheY-like chemotaxis protein/Tfp pilus assembly protein PilZ